MENLIKIQAELKAPKNQTNSFGKYKYRSSEDILEAVKPLLNKYGCLLTISDKILELKEGFYIEATVTFTDKEKSISVTSQAGVDVTKKGMDTSQCYGASSSYARKYALNGLFLIDDTKDSDAVNTHGNDPKSVDNTTELTNAIKEINDCKSLEELKSIWSKYSKFQTAEVFIKTKEAKKTKLTNGK